MPIDINKHEVDIDTLFKQNENDLVSIKEIYKKLKDLEKKILQIKYIDTTLADKLKKDYEELKRIILDENIQAKLTNDIKEINIELNTKASLNISNLNDKIDFSIYSEIPYPIGFTVQQGACITDNYVIIGLTNDDDSNSIIRVYDKTSLNFINEFTGQFYHINSITFNNDTKKIIITHCISNGVDKNTISIIEESELIKSSPIVETKILTRFTQVQAIAYGNGKYYLNSTTNKNTIYVLDENFNIVYSFKTIDSAILQDI